MIVSSHNALTLWWHIDDKVKTKNEESGFRILWSAFRKPTNRSPCLLHEEFQCSNLECIPSNLACNRFADCEDSSDLEKSKQIAHNCKSKCIKLFLAEVQK